jgi:hypothetical protein
MIGLGLNQDNKEMVLIFLHRTIKQRFNCTVFDTSLIFVLLSV